MMLMKLIRCWRGQEYFDIEKEQDDPDDGIIDSHLQIYPKGSSVFIDGTYPTTLTMYTIGGTLVRVLDVRPGINTYSGIPAGIYIVGQKKVQLK